MLQEFRLPSDFLMGSATSALQIEGGDRNNSWYDWCKTPGRIKDGSDCFRADDHWNRYAEDIKIMKQLHHDVYRMGLEWSRIEPEQGKYDQSAMAHYRTEIELLIQNGIKPLITLNHFSIPLWLDRSGGWENPKIVDYFTAYTRYVVNNLGDLVSDWITINEPNVFFAYGYAMGIWPPGKTDFPLLFKALRIMVHAHIQSYNEIHKIRAERSFAGKTLVGIAYHFVLFEAENNNLLDNLSARLYIYLFQNMFLESLGKGKMKFPLGLGGYPFGKGRYYDFIGINYYTRNLVRFKLDPAELFGELIVKENTPINDVGTEIYPKGLYRICKSCYDKYRVPIFITENGLSDSHDKMRSRFIYDHLQQIARLIEEGVPVQRYYHWSLLDNFEWEQGESVRYGLVANNFETQERTIRASGRFYGEICRSKAVTHEMMAKYMQSS